MTQKKMSTNTVKPADVCSWIVLGILALLPLSTIFTIWAGSNFGHLDLFRIWKELIIFAVAVCLIIVLVKDTKLKREVFRDNIIRLIAIYICFSVILGLIGLSKDQANNNALIYGLLANLRFVGFFVVTFVLAKKSDILRKLWQKALLIPAGIIVVFGLMQQFLLPNDFLRHFGYGEKTIIAVHTVDQKIDFLRIQSTLRGPNPLGAYLVLVITSLVVLYNKYRKNILVLLGLGAILAMFYTYSRSAWIGLSVSLFLALYWMIRNSKTRKYILLATISVVLIMSGIVWTLRDNNFVQNTVFHTDETSQSSQSSNETRTRSQIESLKEAANEPFGRGVGTAGPASFRNNNPPRISENYFTQIAQEVGLTGLFIFLVINVLVFIRLFKQKSDSLSLILLASLVGITIINILSHAWADDTLGLLWWGLAGIALATPKGGGIILFKAKNGKK